MEERNYKPLQTYLDSSLSNNNELNSYSSSLEIITFSQSEKEYELKSLFKEKNSDTEIDNDKKIVKDKYTLNVDTLQSLRISHSLEESQKSLSLIDIINKGKFYFNENEMDNMYKNKNMSEINTIKKKNKNNNKNEKGRNTFTKNNINGAYNSFYKTKKSFLSNNSNNKSNSSNNNINNNKTSAMTKNSILKNKMDNSLKQKNNKYCTVFSSNKKNDNETSVKKFKIQELFKEKFEEKIKPKSNKLADNKELIFNSNNTTGNNESTFNTKYLEYQHLKGILNYSSKNAISSYNKCKEKIKKSNKKEKEKKINSNIKYENTPQKNKELVYYSDNHKKSSIETIDDIDSDDENIYYKKNKKKIFKNGKKSGIIVNLFGTHFDSYKEEEDKNIMISELDIELSDPHKKINNNKKNMSNEKIKLNNKIIEKVLKNGFFTGHNNTNHSNTSNNKKNIINKEKKVLFFNYNNNSNKYRIINGYNNKKGIKFHKMKRKIIYPIKKVNSYSNITNTMIIKKKEDNHYSLNIMKKIKKK